MPAPLASLEETLARLSASPGDEAAWSDLYLGLWPFVLARIARHLRGYSPHTEDLAQEVFIRLAHYRPFDRLTDPGDFRAYLAVMCRNVTSSHVKKLLHAPALHSLDDSLVEMLPARDATDVATVEGDLWKTLDEGLSEKDRKLLRWLLAGFDTEEIARHLGASYGTTAVRMFRLRRRLRRRLDAQAAAD